MKKANFFGKLMLFFVSVGLLTSCSSDDNNNTTPAQNTIAAIASNNPDFSILVQALDRVGLVPAVNGTDLLTVFAPTNQAFTNFLETNGFSSLDEVPDALLTQVLLNHVVSGRVLSNQLTTGYVSTLATGMASNNNLSMFINTDGEVTINGTVGVITPDIMASNGVIHVVNAVIGLPTLVTFATADPNFSILVQALTRGDQPDFVSILSGNGPFTVFAPTNDAFVALLGELGATELADIDQATLTATLQYHVVGDANVLSSALNNGQSVTTLQGGAFTVNISGSNVTITDVANRVTNIVAVDVQANNGVIHVVDRVLLPIGG